MSRAIDPPLVAAVALRSRRSGARDAPPSRGIARPRESLADLLVE